MAPKLSRLQIATVGHGHFYRKVRTQYVLAIVPVLILAFNPSCSVRSGTQTTIRHQRVRGACRETVHLAQVPDTVPEPLPSNK